MDVICQIMFMVQPVIHILVLDMIDIHNMQKCIGRQIGNMEHFIIMSTIKYRSWVGVV